MLERLCSRLPLLMSWALHSISYASFVLRCTCPSCPSRQASVRWSKGIFLHRPIYLESPSTPASSEPYLCHIKESSKDSFILVADLRVVQLCLFVLRDVLFLRLELSVTGYALYKSHIIILSLSKILLEPGINWKSDQREPYNNWGSKVPGIRPTI